MSLYARVLLMRFNANVFLLFLFVVTLNFSANAQDDVPSFREELYYSEVDRDQRTPQAVRVGGVVFVSAMSAPGETLEEQLKTCYIRLQSVLGNYGLRMADVAQERVYLKSGQASDVMRSARLTVYNVGSAPASTMVTVDGFENSSTLVEIELIAVANPEIE